MKNPFLTALTFVTVLSGVVTAGLYAAAGYLVGQAGPEPGNAGFTQVVAANTWLAFTGLALLVTLAVGAMLWKSPAARARDEYLSRVPRPKAGHDDD